MKRFLIICAIVAVLATGGYAADQQLQKKSILFSGQLRTQAPSYTLADTDYTAIKNMRYSPAGIRGRYGMSVYSSNATPSARAIKQIIPYRKGDGTLTKIVQAVDSGTSYYYEMETTTISSTALLTTTNAVPCSWAVVNDHLLIGDDSGVYIWSGASTPITGALRYNGTAYANIWEYLYSDVYASVSFDFSTDTVYIGFQRPFTSITWDVTTGSAVTSVSYKYYSTADTWTAVSGLTGTYDLSADGTASWTRPSNWVPSIVNGKYKYWIQITGTAGSPAIDSASVYTEFEEIGDIWSGKYLYANGAVLYDASETSYVDYTGFVYVDNTATYLDASEMTSSDAIYLGFPELPRTIHIDMVPGHENTETATGTLSFWSGSAFTSCTSFSDGTSSGSITLAQSGDWTYANITTAVKSQQCNITRDLYWFKFVHNGSNAFPEDDDSDDDLNGVRIWQIKAVPVPDPPEGYTRVASFKGRAWLYGGPESHIMAYSARDLPDTFNGDDSHTLTIGDKSEIIKAVPFYNEMMVFKDGGEVGLVEGYSRSTFAYERLATTSGLLSVNSAVPVESGIMTGGSETRSIALYQGANGFRYCDGLKTPLIGDDVSAYFDANDSLAISSAYLDDGWAWVDYENNEYHCIMGDGTEFVFNLDYNRWSTFDRGVDIAGAVSFLESNRWVTLGLGDDGYVYRLESGTDDDGADIDYEVITKDLVFIDDYLLSFRGLLISGSQGTDGVDVSYALDGNTSYTAFSSSMSVSKTGYSYAMPDTRMNSEGHSIRFKIEPEARMDLYKYSVFFTPVRDLREEPGN